MEQRDGGYTRGGGRLRIRRSPEEENDIRGYTYADFRDEQEEDQGGRVSC